MTRIAARFLGENLPDDDDFFGIRYDIVIVVSRYPSRIRCGAMRYGNNYIDSYRRRDRPVYERPTAPPQLSVWVGGYTGSVGRAENRVGGLVGGGDAVSYFIPSPTTPSRFLVIKFFRIPISRSCFPGFTTREPCRRPRPRCNTATSAAECVAVAAAAAEGAVGAAAVAAAGVAGVAAVAAVVAVAGVAVAAVAGVAVAAAVEPRSGRPRRAECIPCDRNRCCCYRSYRAPRRPGRRSGNRPTNTWCASVKSRL